jgi:hypothetical protein
MHDYRWIRTEFEFCDLGGTNISIDLPWLATIMCKPACEYAEELTGLINPADDISNPLGDTERVGTCYQLGR